jgi:tight adherence protein B
MGTVMVVVAASALIPGMVQVAADVRAMLIVRRTRRSLVPRSMPRPGRWRELRWLQRWSASAAARQVDAALPAWLDACVRAARSGATLRDALRDGAMTVTSPALRAQLAPFLAGLDAGDGLATALDELDERSSAMATLQRVLRLAVSVGGPSAPALDAVATTLHERAALGRELRALSASARASAMLMALAPMAFAAMASLVDPRVGSFFLSVSGAVCLMVGLALEAVGAWWMVRIVRSVR